MEIRYAIENMNAFIEFFSFFFIFFHMDFQKKTQKRTVGIVCCVLIWLAGILTGYVWNRPVLGPFPRYLVLIYFLFFLLFDVKGIELILMEIGQWLFLSMLEAAIYILLEHFSLERYILENMTMLIITCCLWIFYFIIGKKFDSLTFRLPVKVWFLLDFIMFILTAMMSFFIYVVVQKLPNSRIMTIGRALSALGVTLIVIMLFVMIYYYNSTNNFRMQKELMEVQNEQQREYFLQLLEKEEETRKFRHDVINDFLAIQNFCQEKKYNQLENYLRSTLGVVQSISKSSYDVGNDIVNTVLNYYLQPLKEKYHVEVRGGMGEDISIEQRDLCVLSANLIKNASEAVTKLENGKIAVEVTQGRQYLCIKVDNSFAGQLVFDKRGNPKTFKLNKRNHGFGIHNIRQIVKKYDGVYDAEVKNGMYSVEVCLKI